MGFYLNKVLNIKQSDMKFTFCVLVVASFAIMASANPIGDVQHHILDVANDLNGVYNNVMQPTVNAVNNVKDQVVSTINHIDWNPFHALSNGFNYLKDQLH